MLRRDMQKAGQVLVKSLRDAWSAFSIFIMVNGLWFVTSLAIITIPGSLGGVYYVMGKLSNGDKVELGDFFFGFRMYYFKTLGLVLPTFIVFCGLSAGLMWFLSSPSQMVRALGTLWLYAILYLAFMFNYFLPLLMRGFGFAEIVRTASGLVSEYLYFTLALSLFAIVVAGISVFTGALLVLFFMGFVSLLQSNGLSTLEYDIIERS
jgi:hypothetical protein